MILASDPSAALFQHTKKVVYLKDYEMAVVDGENYTIHKFQKTKRLSAELKSSSLTDDE